MYFIIEMQFITLVTTIISLQEYTIVKLIMITLQFKMSTKIFLKILY